MYRGRDAFGNQFDLVAVSFHLKSCAKSDGNDLIDCEETDLVSVRSYTLVANFVYNLVYAYKFCITLKTA